MSNVYRMPLPTLPYAPQVGFYTTCPDCGATALRCDGCHKHATDRVKSERHGWCPAPGNGHFDTDGLKPPYYLEFLYDTDTHLCSPHHRVRFGFLWLRKCQESGVHAHQHCQRCRWRGIALVQVDGAPRGR